jgi:4-amino-4-deoxy-L-arabinose transferase-like glycosyltransferase
VLAAGTLAGERWLVNAAAAGIAVGLTFVVGRRFYDARTGLLAGLLLALSPFFVLQAGSLLSHVVALCWVLLLLLLFDTARNSAVPAAAIGAGAAVGMLLLTRPLTAVGVALPFAAVALIDLLRRRPMLGRYALMALGLLPFAVLLLAYNDATTGSPFRSAYELWWSYDRIGFGPEYGVNGHSIGDAIRNTRSNLDDLSAVLFGWPRRLSLLPVGLAALAAAWRIRREGFTRATGLDLLLAGVVVSVVAVHMLYWTPGNALVFVPRPNWQAYAPLFLENSTTLDGDVIYAVDRGDERNVILMREFPGRIYYRYQDGDLSRLPGPSTGSAPRWWPG